MSTVPVLHHPQPHEPPRPPPSARPLTRQQGQADGKRRPRATSNAARFGLRQRLLATDAAGASASWSLAIWLDGPVRPPSAEVLTAMVLATVTVLAVASRRLYQARVAQFRSQEIQQLGHVALLSGLAAGGLSHWAGTLTPAGAVGGAMLTFGMLLLGRSLYRGWVAERRRTGRFHRQVVVMGANEEAVQLLQLLADHPELGLTAVGVVGAAADYHRLGLPVPLLGDVAGAGRAIEEADANGALVASTAFEPHELNALVRDLLDQGVHVQLSSGLFGIAHGRLRANPLAHEPLFYVEPLWVSPWQRALKRAMDIVLGSVALLLALPVIAVAAVAITLDDRGPIFFRQARVGRGGRTFEIVKLRTMVADAQGRYEELAPKLAARTGPLVKLHSDPRITRVGHFLRVTSIDELPQLAQVVAGTMSLVGPRPNLVAEVVGIDPAYLHAKAAVRPGVTGLWQVEARDNPSFNTYRRLDLFYLENWSLSFDLALLFATVEHLVARFGVALRPSRMRAKPVPG